MATWQRRTSGLPTTPQRATSQHQVYDGSRRRRQDLAPWCWHLQKSRRLLAPQRIKSQPALLPSPYSIKSSVNRTLIQRAYNLCDPDSLPKEPRHVKITLQHNGYKPSKINTSKPVSYPDCRVSSTQSLTLSTCLPYLGSTSHKLQRILQQACIKVYHSAPTNFKDFSTPIRINRIPATEREYTRSLVSVVKSSSGNMTESTNETERTPSTRPQRRFLEVSHCEVLPHQGPPNLLAGSSTHHTHQHMASQTHHRRGHRDLQAWHCSTGHRFLHQRYLATPTTDRRIFYIQNPQPTPDWGISYILSQPPSLPLCLLTTDSVQWAQTPPPPPPPHSKDPSPTMRFPACTLQYTNPPASSLRVISQSPALSWWRSEHTDRNVKL